MTEGKLRRREARKAKRELAKKIRTLADSGRVSREIAAALGIKDRHVRRVIETSGISGGRAHQRRFAFYTPRRRAELIRRLADHAGVSTAVMLDRIVSVVLDDGFDRAIRSLGKLAGSSKRTADGGEV